MRTVALWPRRLKIVAIGFYMRSMTRLHARTIATGYVERPSYSAGSLKIVMGFTFFFAVGCASGSYVEWFFVGSGTGRGRLLFFAFCIIICIFFVCSC